jgi:uncharacterized membrane protein
MNTSQRFSAFIAYLLPVIGWVYVLLFQRKNPFAVFHLRQAIGLFLFLIVVFAGWVVVGWVLAWIPFMLIFSVALFTLVISAFIFGLATWVIGMSNALRGRMVLLPLFGKVANGMDRK